ncbi:Add66p Ecym_3145 [Eremothecium cymbalariae DBVPG|uniref:Proteasome assembly chaperone 2 n=1 Tax=Eremothecium cymbalariae (strain CBS 270.75 / DBVPG 7215 / KCTC 17166 / NRRL Y-17582) TaxID=931890 RepID=G8JR79_ERECY|nr:Hypothetical protein Ecym_3145 [Eremothecium cymbalariae DBVPG\
MSTLVIPLVSAGNVPQLFTDVVLHSLANEFKFVKELDSRWLHPFVGPLDYVADQETTLYRDIPNRKYTASLELFHNESRGLYLLQQRSPVLQGYENEFCKYVLIPLIQELTPKRVLVLDSVGAFESNVPMKVDSSGSRFSFATCDATSIEDVAQEFQERLQLDKDTELSINRSLFKFTDSSFQDGISTTQFIFKLSYHLLHTSIPVSSDFAGIFYFSMFIHEGDNHQDALLTCEILPQLMPSFPAIKKVVTPVSWSGVYGLKTVPDGFCEGLYV